MADLGDHDDPEASYRRGYQQGAYAAFQAVERVPIDKVRHWIEIKLFEWRYHDRPRDRSFQPPSAN